MSPHYSGEWLFIISTALIIAFRAFIFKRQFWDAPLNHGPGFFLGVEVAPGFYEGEGVRWLSRYHRAWIFETVVEALMLVGVIVMAPRLLMWTGFRRQRRVAAMGRNLRPEGSWRTPFRPAAAMMAGFRPWFAVWFGGLVMLVVFLRP